MPTETTFLLARHGATAHTAERRFSGSTGLNPPLSALGEWQAGRLAAALRDDGRVDLVVTSPIRRARQTAERVAAALGVAVLVAEGLREVDFGAWEGRTLAEVAREWPAELAAWRARATTAPPGGESVERVAERVWQARHLLARAHPGATMLLVSHLYPVRLSVLDALDGRYEAVHRMALEPTAISELRVGEDATTRLVRYNDDAHLRGPDAAVNRPGDPSAASRPRVPDGPAQDPGRGDR